MIREAIVLAGGLGTRLKAAVPDLPKCLAPVAGRPFLEYLIRYGQTQGIERFVFALGYKTEQVEEFVRSVLPPSAYAFSVEDSPLGTGGAVMQACLKVRGMHSFVLNADSFFKVDLAALSGYHETREADCVLSLKPMQRFDRYGVVELNDAGVVTGFSEKKYMDAGLINGGLYALQVKRFLSNKFPAAFSLEKDYLETQYAAGGIRGMVCDAYFIDIGIPADYQRAQTELIQHIPDGIRFK